MRAMKNPGYSCRTAACSLTTFSPVPPPEPVKRRGTLRPDRTREPGRKPGACRCRFRDPPTVTSWGRRFSCPTAPYFRSGPTTTRQSTTSPVIRGRRDRQYPVARTAQAPHLADDSTGCELPNGDVIFGADESSPETFTAPTHLFLYNPTAGTITDITPSSPNSLSSTLANEPAFLFRMLALPNGQVLLSGIQNEIWEYNPSVSPNSAWEPTVRRSPRTAATSP